MKVILILVEGLIAILVIVGIYLFNKFTRLKNKCDAASSVVKAHLMKRYSLLTRLIDVTKGYSKHEKETLEGGIRERRQFDSSRLENIISVLEEKYPELKADKNFTNLASQVEEVEKELFKAREEYGEFVLSYNNTVTVFPSNLFAFIFEFKPLEYIEYGGVDLSDSAFESFLG